MSDAEEYAEEAYDEPVEDEPAAEDPPAVDPRDQPPAGAEAEDEVNEAGDELPEPEPGEEPLPSPPPAASSGKRSLGMELAVDVDERTSEESLPSAAFDTPVTRQVRTLAAELEGALSAGTDGRAEAIKAEQESWPAVPSSAESRPPSFAEIKAAAPPGQDELDVAFETGGPLGIVFRSTVPVRFSSPVAHILRSFAQRLLRVCSDFAHVGLTFLITLASHFAPLLVSPRRGARS